MERIAEDIDKKFAEGNHKKIEKAPVDIEGWGYDADPSNDPTHPMKRRDGSDYQRNNYEKASQQPVTTEVFHSNERPSITRVFGTSTPPSGLSGRLRRFAFRFSENHMGHWMTLLLADRVNVVEGIVDDLKHGIVPNIIKERGWTAEWKYNRKGAIKSIAIGTAITAVVIGHLIYRNRHKKALSS